MTTAIQKTDEIQLRTLTDSGGAFSSVQKFDDAQRMAKLLCASSIVPTSYRENIADCVIALEMANRIGANPLAVMQNLYIVHGRPAWSSQFLISCVNASGKFSPLRYQETGVRTDDSWGCVAWAQDRTGERLESPEITIGMAKAEGWFQRNGSKWKTMPQLMLRYRAATLFARLFAPELTMGINCEEEVYDIAPVVTDPIKPAAKAIEMFTKKAEPKPNDDQIPGAEMPAKAPEPAKETVKEESPAQLAKRMILEAGVAFDMFTAEVVVRNIAREDVASTWPDYDAVPSHVWNDLGSNHKALAAITKKWGKKE